MTNRMKQVGIIVLIGTIGAQVGNATCLSYSNSKSGSAGDKNAGATYTITGSATGDDSPKVNEACIRITGDVTARFLGMSGQLGYINAQVRSKANKGNVSVLVKACGYNVANTSEDIKMGTSKSRSVEYATTFLRANATFWVSAIPVNFSGAVGGGVSLTATYSVGPLRADLVGGPHAWGSVSAKAGIGIGGYTIGDIGTEAKLADLYLKSDAKIGFLGGEKSGGVSLIVKPVRADIWYQIRGFKKQIISQWAMPETVYNIVKVK